ncbi:hypothetical protein LguiA_031927 [Lonicera macranthoides]
MKQFAVFFQRLNQSSHMYMSQKLNYKFSQLAESIQAILTDFESSIQKNSSKAITVGSKVHPLTNSAMNYMQYLANYSGALRDIFADSLSLEKSISPLPESYFDSLILAVTV